jgi:dipeptidyl aminopeptidase/acylaminoacyl peptidase
MMRAHASAFSLLLVCAVLPARAQRPTDKLTLNDYLEWESIQAPRFSPDGKQIVFGRRWVDKLNDRWEASLWIMNADGSRNRFLVNGSSPQWSPDGTRLAYLAKGEPSGTQLFVRWMDAEGGTTQLTRVTETPADLEWSPDGKTLAFRMLVPVKEKWDIGMPAAPKGAKWTEAPRVVTRFRYRLDRQGYVDDGYRHLFVVPADGGTPRQLTSGDFDHATPAWSRDGRRLFVIQYFRQGYRVRLYDLARAQLRPGELRPQNDDEPMRGYAAYAIGAPDGHWLLTLYVKPQDHESFVHALDLRRAVAYCIDLPGRGSANTMGKWALALSPDGRTLVAANPVIGTLAEIDLRTLELAPTLHFPGLLEKGNYVNAAFSPRGDVVYFGGLHGLRAYDLRARRVRGPYYVGRVGGFAFTPDGRKLLVVHPAGRVDWLDAATGDRI